MTDFAQRVFPHLLAEWGYVAIILAVIADSLGLPVPGEVMLMLAAVYAGATHHLSLPFVIGAAVVGAIIGDNFTYTVGRRGGYPLLRRHGEKMHIGRRRLKIGEYLFRRYGPVVVMGGRLIPVLHIWTALLAGVNRMPWLRFALTNAVGAVVWATALSLAGYGLGRAALHFGGLIAAGALPLAVLIGVVAILLLHANERRLYEEAERALGDEDQPAGADRPA